MRTEIFMRSPGEGLRLPSEASPESIAPAQPALGAQRAVRGVAASWIHRQWSRSGSPGRGRWRAVLEERAPAAQALEEVQEVRAVRRGDPEVLHQRAEVLDEGVEQAEVHLAVAGWRQTRHTRVDQVVQV